MHTSNTRFSHKSNAGAVLAVTMVMMLLLSTIGLSSMRSAKLETLMARNLQQKQTSFNNAESSVLFGEAAWDADLVSCLESPGTCPAGFDAFPAVLENVDGAPNISSIDWSTENIATNFGRYKVEFLNKFLIPGESNKWLFVYRITSKGVDTTGVSTTLVQTIYRRCMVIPEPGAPMYSCPS